MACLKSLGIPGLLIAFSIGVSAATAPPPSEYRVKAAFLFNFARFVDWPAITFVSASSPFALCVYGDDPFGPDLDAIVQGESIAGRAMVVRRIRELDAVVQCQIVFVSGSADSELEAVVEKLGHRPTLVVSDVESAARRGAIIRMMTVNNRVRLLVNIDAARAAHLTISSNLLRAAEVVGTTSQGEGT